MRVDESTRLEDSGPITHQPCKPVFASQSTTYPVPGGANALEQARPRFSKNTGPRHKKSRQPSRISKVRRFSGRRCCLSGRSRVYSRQDNDAANTQQVRDQSHRSRHHGESVIRSERNGVYEGNIVKIFFKPGQDKNWVCSKCEGSDKGAEFLGFTLIKGMVRNGLWFNGTVRDPRDGSVYRASMKVSTDGKKLEMRGYLGISLFGRSQVWNRLPDNALGPPVTSVSPTSKAGVQKNQ